MRIRALFAVGVVVLLGGCELAAEAGAGIHAPSASDFVAEARAATASYHDQRTAVANGFRRVGTDFPAMGEHWVNPRRVIADSFSAAYPSVLAYVDVGGVPTLVGVAYTVLLEPGEALPAFAPAAGFWHEHNGSVVEESFPLTHHARPAGDEEHRLAILHAWIWSDNPDGLFVTDNWALPFIRLGITPPVAPSAGAVGAIALALGGEPFYAQTLRTAAALGPQEETAAAAVLARHADRIRAELDRVRSLGQLTPEAERELAHQWQATWAAVERALPRHAERVRALVRSGALAGTPGSHRH